MKSRNGQTELRQQPGHNTGDFRLIPHPAIAQNQQIGAEAASGKPVVSRWAQFGYICASMYFLEQRRGTPLASDDWIKVATGMMRSFRIESYVHGRDFMDGWRAFLEEQTHE
jgi:hypothetical protein